MKLLLLHPEDRSPVFKRSESWDLVVDLARAPASTYENWSREAGCTVISLYEFAEEVADLHYLRQLLQLGLGAAVDDRGVDWWDVLSLMILPALQEIMLARRLAKKLGRVDELYSSRPSSVAVSLSLLLGARTMNAESRVESVSRRAERYLNLFRELDHAQLFHVIQDKFDPQHAIRRRFAVRNPTSRSPVILLPSAYVNVSRTATSYASMLPGSEFLLVCARASGRLESLPPNVRMASLDGYFMSLDRREIASLLESWCKLKARLVSAVEEYKIANLVGVFERIPALLRWGIAMRDAWNRVFELEDIVGCLCADDSNPYSRIPLILAKQRDLPAVACHHGALDWRMGLKEQHADFYLAKGAMERDYLERVCRVEAAKIVIGAHHNCRPAPLEHSRGDDKPWLVFFTEPYETWGWRIGEIYRDLLPRLLSVAQTCGLKLVFKLHPFESVKRHRRFLNRYLPRSEEHKIEVISAQLSRERWLKIRFAMTVQSTIALECSALGIPAFLCAWLRDPYAAYVEQYARFGVGHILERPEQIAGIPQTLQGQRVEPSENRRVWHEIEAEDFRDLLMGLYSERARGAQCLAAV